VSDQKDLITFEQALPIISQSLDSLIFVGLKTNISNLYRAFADFVRRQSDDLSPVSFVIFISWFMEKPYYFKFNEDGYLKNIYRRLSDNPDYESIKKFIQFYVVWQLDVPQDTKTSLGIYFALDNALNDLEKIILFGKQFDLETNYEFYDKDEENTFVLNKVEYPFLSEDSIDKLKEILDSEWKLFGSVLSKNNEFWKLLENHVNSHKKVFKE